MEKLHLTKNKSPILLIILTAIFIVSAVRAADEGKTDKSGGGGPLAFLQNIFIFSGFGGKKGGRR